jgi:hypothetical protein
VLGLVALSMFALLAVAGVAAHLGTASLRRPHVSASEGVAEVVDKMAHSKGSVTCATNFG